MKIRRFIFLAAVAYLLAAILGGIVSGWIALHPPSPSITAAEERNAKSATKVKAIDFQDAELKTPDGATLSAWFMRPREGNGNAVILLHGVSDNRMGMYGFGWWLLENGYAVLLPDARGHGLSSGLATYGLLESDNIRRWVDWLDAAAHPKCVFGLGESMGAAQLLQALPKDPRFCAVVAESPFATFREIAYARYGQRFGTGPWLGKTLFWPTVEVGFLYVHLRYGFDMDKVSPAEAVTKTRVPILLIHGLDDRNIPPFHSDEIYAQNPSDMVLWKVPGAPQVGAHQTAPAEFERRVLEWFQIHSQPLRN